MTTRTYTVSECSIATFDLVVPADLEGDELDEYLENERVNGNHTRTTDGVESVEYYEATERQQ